MSEPLVATSKARSSLRSTDHESFTQTLERVVAAPDSSHKVAFIIRQLLEIAFNKAFNWCGSQCASKASLYILIAKSQAMSAGSGLLFRRM